MNRSLGGREKSVTDSVDVLMFSISNIENLKKRLVFYIKLHIQKTKVRRVLVLQDPDGYKNSSDREGQNKRRDLVEREL